MLVSSDIGGVREYTQNNVDSFLIKPNSKDDFATRIIDLLQNDQKRTDVAKIGVQHANQFNINASTKMLLDAFKNERINH